MPSPLRPRAAAEPAPPAAGEGSSGEDGQGPGSGFAPAARVVDTDPPVALGVRVPRSLDDRLAILGVQLRMRGIRRTKAELVAHVLRQLPAEVTDEFATKVAS